MSEIKMENYLNKLTIYSNNIGFTAIKEIDPDLLVPEKWIRDLCQENKCGNYGNNYMCPPLVGSLNNVTKNIKKYKKCVLLQHAYQVDVKKNPKKVESSKIDFHKKILQIEVFLDKMGIKNAWGIIGGSCSFCGECHAKSGQPCPQPDKARPSLESMGIAIMAMLETLSLDAEFSSDRVTWTGCVLFNV